MFHKLYHFIWDTWWYYRSKDFEAMKARKSAIWPKSQFLFHKNLPPRDFSIMTFWYNVEPDAQNLRLINEYLSQIEVQTVILRYWTGLKLNWFSYDTKCKYLRFQFSSDFCHLKKYWFLKRCLNFDSEQNGQLLVSAHICGNFCANGKWVRKSFTNCESRCKCAALLGADMLTSAILTPPLLKTAWAWTKTEIF